MRRYPALAAPLPMAIAHRGGAWEAPENSPTAFERAHTLGYRYFETDVRATADDVALAFHDADLGRVTGRSISLREVPWSLVQTIKIHGVEPIMRLDDLLDTYQDTVFNVDVKEKEAIEPFVKAVRSVGAADRVVVASFSHRRLRQVRRLMGPTLASSLSPQEVWALYRLAQGKSSRWSPQDLACVQVPETFGGRHLVTPAFVQTVHKLGLQVHVWTINDETSMNRILDLGVDAIMTDKPPLLRQVLISRGQWHGPA